jgi:hypothetical protein
MVPVVADRTTGTGKSKATLKGWLYARREWIVLKMLHKHAAI